MTLMSAPRLMICAQPIATNIALTRLDLMNAFVVKDMKRSLVMTSLIDRTIALILTNVHLQPTIVILTQLARTKNHCGRVDVMMDIMVTVITASKLTTVSQIHVHSILNASGQGSKDYLSLPLVHAIIRTNDPCKSLATDHTCICDNGYEGVVPASGRRKRATGGPLVPPLPTSSGTTNPVAPVSISSLPTGHTWTHDMICQDIDECTTATTCDTNADCHNVRGHYRCECQLGWEGTGLPAVDGCKNIDECATGRDKCDEEAICTDTPGSFTCECPQPDWADIEGKLLYLSRDVIII